jgi:hypothetical protein
MDLDAMEGRYAELDEYTVGFETYKQDLDAGPYFRGLPDDRCSCVHLGYVTSVRSSFATPTRGDPTLRVMLM